MRADETTALWTKYASNPVLTGSTYPAGELAAKPGGGWYLFIVNYDNTVHRWESADLITWSNDTQVFAGGGVGAWDVAINGVMVFQKPDNSWLMLYRGNDGADGYHIGLATSADSNSFTRKDNGGVDDGLFPQFGNNYDPFC